MSSGAGSSNGSSSSVSGFLSTLIPVAAQAAAFVGIFILLRTVKTRVYRPRTFLQSLKKEEKGQKLPDEKFGWLKTFRTTPDEYGLNHNSLDAYLYLRFFKLLVIICFVGCLITWPILFPVNATGDGGQTQFDLLSFSNIGGDQKNRYYAHVLVAWVFMGFIMYMITRETMYYINLRHAYLLAPFNAARISARTVLFTDVPDKYLNGESLRELFGASMARYWLTTNFKELEGLVEERDNAAFKLEAGELKMIKNANDKRLKWEKKNKKKPQPRPQRDAADMEGGNGTSEWLSKKDRPTNRLKLWKIPFIGKKVDTIDWSRSELNRLNPEVNRGQSAARDAEGNLVPVVFVEFSTQLAAETAYRRMSRRKAPHMNPQAISATPHEIIWKNLRIKSKERFVRSFVTASFLTAMIIFWSIPVAVIGAISNINYLTNRVTFLRFIDNIPQVILGVVTGLLPSLLLSILMSLVPIVCRLMGRLSGRVTLPLVELYCQSWYFAFQIVQVFLITTFSSGAASVATQIVNNPSSATTLLAENLPKASNFYISYIIVQALGVAAGYLLNIGALIMLTVVGKILDKSPRKMYNRYIKLAGMGWGSLYPVFGNLGVIAIAYSCIAPLVMGFATVGFVLLYFAARYNIFYVWDNHVDTKGLAYARALQHLTAGVYLSEVCLIGLFAINTSPGPIVLAVILLVVTALYHALMRHALRPLTRYLPDSLDEDSTAMFETSRNGKFDASKSSAPPSSASNTPINKMHRQKATLLSRIFDPRKFHSAQKITALVPQHDPPSYEAATEDMAYYNPAATAELPVLWIPRDDMGISRREIRDCEEAVPGIRVSDVGARFDEKGKVAWDSEDLREVPIWEEKIRY